MSGRKSKVLVDSIDLDILTTLNPYSYINIGLGVLELAKKINLTHQNLKRHLEKLIKARLVLTLTSSGSNKISLVTPYYFHDYNGDNEEQIKKDVEEYEAILSFLKKMNNLDYEKETISKISREMKDNFSKRINYKKELNRLKRNEKIADEVIKERENDTNAPKPKTSKHKESIKK